MPTNPQPTESNGPNVTKRTKGGRPADRGLPAKRAAARLSIPAQPEPRGSGAPPLTGRYAEPPGGAAYPQLLRGKTFSPMQSLIGVVLGVGLFLLVTAVITQAVVMLGWALTSPQTRFADYYTSALRFERPVGMLGANLGLAVLIPISAGLMLLMHRVAPSWLISVQAKVRWRYAAVCLAIALIALGGVLSVSVLVGPGTGMRPQNSLWVFLLIIFLTSPLQAAAEEVFFRGYLSQALGSLFSNPWFGVVGSAVLFALFHGGQNLPLFLDRLAFGLLAGILVLKTGGLEASIAAHVVNNLLAYATAGLTGTIAELRGVSDIDFADAALDVGGFALFAAAAWLMCRRMRIATTTAKAT